MKRREFFSSLGKGAALSGLVGGTAAADLTPAGAAAKHAIRDDPPFDLHGGRLRGADGTVRRP